MTGEPNLISNQMYTLAQQAVQAGHANVQMAVENERLRHRLNQRQATEDAYSQVQPHQGATLVLDRTGRWVELLNREVEWAGYYVPQPPSEQRPFYAIQLKEIDRVLCLSEQEFINDKVLIQRIQELPGVEVKFRQSQRTTAFLLRKAFKPLPYNLPFYGGWLLSQEEDLDFKVFPTLSTHRAGDEFCDVVPLPALELPIHAVREWKRMGAIVADANVRWLLQLWFHGAVLTTLLEHMGYPIPLALCLCTTGNAWPSWLRGFFQWFGDPALSLDMLPVEFRRGLLYRRDQPLLVVDSRQNAYAPQNSELLERALTSRTVPWGKDSGLTLKALPVIISPAATSLSCSPRTITLDLVPEQLNLSKDTHFSEWSSAMFQYLNWFIRYTKNTQLHLRKLLKSYVSRAENDLESPLDADCARTLGILLALDDHIHHFAVSIGASGEEAEKNGKERWLRWLLEQTTWKTSDSYGLADRFLSIARSHLSSGFLEACPVEYEKLPSSDAVVFFDKDSLFFTRGAFDQVCGQLDQSQRVILSVLRDTDILCGKPINGTTAMTRIRIYNVYGCSQSVSGYKFRRDVFDRLGDPLILGEEEVR